jgi:hypothetical protein
MSFLMLLKLGLADSPHYLGKFRVFKMKRDESETRVSRGRVPREDVAWLGPQPPQAEVASSVLRRSSTELLPRLQRLVKPTP